jgi:hypothetical protein
MKKISTLFIILVSCTLQFTAKAQLLFRESFSYNAGDLLQGLTGGTGFPAGSTWSNLGTLQGGSAASLNSATIVAGSISPTSSAGNRVQVCAQGTGNRSFFDRSINLTANNDSKTYWLGFWYKGPNSGVPTPAAVPGQIALLTVPNTTPAAIGTNLVTDMKFAAGKPSNTGASFLNGFTGSAGGDACNATQSFPPGTGNSATTFGATALSLPNGDATKYILMKITKAEFTLTSTTPPQNFDGVRIWFLDAQPTSSADPIFTSRPKGDIITTLAGGPVLTGSPPATPTAADYANYAPMQTRAFRPSIAGGAAAPVGSSQVCAITTGGVTGLRIRVEGATSFCFEFDEIAMSMDDGDGSGVASLVLSTTPVTFDAFTARANGEVNELNWATSAEVDNKGFHIEKSSDGVNWNVIGFEKSSGSNNGNYKYIDTKPYDVTYYRLQQEDNGGRSNLSRIVKVLNGKKATIKIYPSVAKNNITLQVPSALVNKQAIVYNNVGAIVATYAINNISKEINVSALASGMYVIKIQDNQNSYTARFIKQ